MGLDDFGNLWLASSPFSAKFASIKKAIDYGINAVVLKSVTPSKKSNQHQGKRTVLRGLIANVDRTIISPDVKVNEQTGELNILDSLYCTSTHLDVETLSIEEANNLYEQIKKYSPHTKVIQSFAPQTIEDFELVAALRADAIEINPRFYQLNLSRPYTISVWKNRQDFVSEEAVEDKAIPEEVRREIKKSLEFKKESRRKKQDFQEQMPALVRRVNVPVLFKMDRDFWDIGYETQLSFPVDGFTYADSQKSGSYQGLTGYALLRWGKGSLCGERLREDTKRHVKLLKLRFPDKYISASGGIMNLEDALKCFENGADSVQICSAIYFHGMKILEQFRQGL